MRGKHSMRTDLAWSVSLTFSAGHLTPGKYSIFVLGGSWLDFYCQFDKILSSLKREREFQMKNCL